MSDPIRWLVLLIFAVGADTGCVQSGNLIGATVWSAVAVLFGWLVYRSRRASRS